MIFAPSLGLAAERVSHFELEVIFEQAIGLKWLTGYYEEK
jgi:hypothetical protein